jgi:hypothetical protein
VLVINYAEELVWQVAIISQIQRFMPHATTQIKMRADPNLTNQHTVRKSNQIGQINTHQPLKEL